jgi:hypothetical protein
VARFEEVFGLLYTGGGRHGLPTRLYPGAAALLVRVKSMLEPRRRMNPGGL